MPEQLLSAALSALGDVERSLLGGVGPTREFLRDGTTLWDPADERIDTSRLADRAARADRRSSEATMRLALRSSIVRVGKLASVEQLKIRSYLVVDGEVRSLKVWSGTSALKTGARERDIRVRIAGIDGYRTPPVLGHGEVGTTAYLLEPVVFGRHPTSGAQRVAMAADLAAALSTAYAATTDGDRRLSRVSHPDLADRLDEVLLDGSYPWPDDVPTRAVVHSRVTKLVRRDRRLPVAVTHGDLVASNVIRDDEARHHLVDWEHGRRGPVAFDLVKLVLGSGDEEAALAAIAPFLTPLDGRGWRRYPVTHQLALGVAQTLSWTPGARERAVRAGRRERFDAEHLQRVRWLDRWLRQD